MENLKNLETGALIDLLISQTEEYKRLNNAGYDGIEFMLCKDFIIQIQNELTARNMMATVPLNLQQANRNV